MLKPEKVWDYPRPPRVEPVPQSLRIVFAGRTIAETRCGFRVLETTHPPVYYLPRDGFACELVLSARQSFCEWKGMARYVTLRASGKDAVDQGWTYPTPTAAFAVIADHIAVYPAAMEACFVGDEQVTPQPGGFYGGWVTANLIGPFKGGPWHEGLVRPRYDDGATNRRLAALRLEARNGVLRWTGTTT